VTVAPPPTQENTTSQNDIWAVELPHGMPKDSHLLPQHSQDLLRAARSGRIYKRPLPVEEEDADPEAILGDKPEKKDDDHRDKGFTAKAWKQIPRHLEGPDEEYLAKRRKGLITLASKAAAGPTMMKTTVRREDAAGNVEVKEVIAPQGAQVQGEVIAQTVVGGAVDRFAHPTPPKRKGAPPKKKMKGPARGRKKKAAPPTSVPAQIDGVAQSVEGVEGAVGPDVSIGYVSDRMENTNLQQGVKIENSENEHGGAVPTANEDTEMADGSVADGSMAASDDEGGEDGEEGDEGEDDGGSVSAQDSPSKPPRPFSPVVSELPHMREPPNLGSPDADMSGTDDLPGPPLPKIDMLEGRPLKNVAMTTSNVTSPAKSQAPLPDSVPLEQSIPETSNILDAAEPTTLDEEMRQEVAETAPTTLPPPPPEPTINEVISSTELLQEEEEEEEMLLDTLENLNANIGAPQDPVGSEPEISVETIHQTEEPEIAIPDPQPTETVEPPSEETQVSEAIEPAEEVAEQPVEAKEPFTDLLGGLEKQVEEPQGQPAPVVETQTELEKPVEPVAVITESVGEEKSEAVSGDTEVEEKTEEVSGNPKGEEKTEGVSGDTEVEEKTKEVSGNPEGEEKTVGVSGDVKVEKKTEEVSGDPEGEEKTEEVSGDTEGA
jgi:hypothetical protein